MNCSEFKQVIDSFLDGELDDQISAEFEIHFTSCKKCREEVESIDKCSKLLRLIMKDENPPENLKDTVFEKLKKDE